MNDIENALSPVAARLKEERLRIDLSPDEAADAWGVGRATQFSYEKSAAAIDVAYLLRAQASGVDIGYVLSGVRGTPGAQRPAAEQDLLNRYQVLPPKLQQVVESVALLAWMAHAERRDYPLAAQPEAPAKKAAAKRVKAAAR